MPKNIPDQMQADLNSRATKHAYCWLIERKDGVGLGFTDHDQDLTFNGVIFKASTGMDASAISNSRNLSIDDMDAIGALSDSSIKASDIAAGLYDGALVTIFKVDWRAVTNRVILLKGPLGKVSRGQVGYKAQMKSLSAFADQKQGRVYGSKCIWNLGEGICGLGVNLQTPEFRDIGLSVTKVINRRVFETTDNAALVRSVDFYQNGQIEWTSGLNSGFDMWVRRHDNNGTVSRFELFESMPESIQIGDTFTAFAGCIKTVEVCKNKFDNVINYGGFPRMPLQDFILSYPVEREKNDGGSLF